MYQAKFPITGLDKQLLPPEEQLKAEVGGIYYKLVISRNDTSFAIHNSEKFLISNIPVGGEDFVEMKVYDPFLTIEKDYKIMQLEFSILNPNYLLLLTDQNQLFILNMLSEQIIEQIIDIEQFLVSSRYKFGYKANKPQIIQFAQALSHTSLGFQPFTITFMTQVGKIYQMSPIMPQEIITTADALSDLVAFTNQKTEDLNTAGLPTTDLEQFMAAMSEGYNSSFINNQNDRLISLTKEHVQSCFPVLQGPLEIVNEEQTIDQVKYIGLKVTNELPFALTRISDRSVEVLISFFQPIIQMYENQSKDPSLKNQKNGLSLVKIGDLQISNYQALKISKLKQNPINNLESFLQANASLYRLDLNMLERLNDRFVQEEQIQPKDLQRGIMQSKMIDSISTNPGHYQCLGNLQVFYGINEKTKKDLIFAFDSDYCIDEAEIFQGLQSKLKQVEEVILTDKKKHKIQPIPIQIQAKFPEIKLSNQNLATQQDVERVLSNINEYLVKTYIPQFDGIEDDLNEKLDHLNKLKHYYIVQARKAADMQAELETKKSKANDGLQQIQKNNNFVNQLQTQVAQGKEAMDQIKTRFDYSLQRDQIVASFLKDAKNFDPEELKKFVLEKKIEMDRLKASIDNMLTQLNIKK
ncbi:UNKNOWN [Stylonychia lemnae]|uniref:Uncharacterized protein n=1 Tax=Stylonychia lemnae TaxID=5949 RepID=A0A078AZI1_STYLE|nr:UNKNOWN [Stylonychia lemnae]|eukprot:CDW87845.1 UNKNOWN [Stylonychia lemnae]